MMRHKFTVGAVAFAFALSVAPALAQQNPRSGGQGSRSGGGERTGAAVPRGGGSAGGAPTGSSSSSSGGSSGGGMSGGGSMGSSSSPSAPSSSGRVGASAAQERAPRRGSGQATGGRAVPRGSSARDGRTSRETGSVTAPVRAGSSSASSSNRRAVPSTSRPRGDNPVTGIATERRVPSVRPGDVYYIYRPYYNPYGFYGSGLGYGLGYLYYDPFWYGGFGYDPYGYGYGGGYGGGYGYGSYGSGGYSQTYRDAGSLRLKVKPREAQVFVDGYFVGVVDSFDGTFQKLTLDGGGHRVEIKADGFEPVVLDVLITPGETVTYKGELQPIK